MSSFYTFLKGLLMGTADIIPGVSGGTMALITGIYPRLVEGISYITDFVRSPFKDFADKFKGIDWKLFIPLGLGIAIAFLALSNLMHFLMSEYASITYAFFLGLIAASAVVLYKGINSTKSTPVFGLLGIIIGIAVVSLGRGSLSNSPLVLFFSGAIAICAMILPGISGAFMLLILNQYEYVLVLIKSLNVVGLLPLVIGAAIGILSFSKLLNFLLHKFKDQTISVLTGLMVGSLLLPITVIWNNKGLPLPIIISCVAGYLIVSAIDKLTTSL